MPDPDPASPSLERAKDVHSCQTIATDAVFPQNVLVDYEASMRLIKKKEVN